MSQMWIFENKYNKGKYKINYLEFFMYLELFLNKIKLILACYIY